MTVQYPSDIPAAWKRFKVKKLTKVRIREAIVREQFEVSWQDSFLTSDPEKDLIIIADAKQYPCKIDIFLQTYEFSGAFEFGHPTFIKREQSTLVAIPEGESVDIITLEGVVKDVQHPDYIVIGKQNEIYANKADFVAKNMILTPYE